MPVPAAPTTTPPLPPRQYRETVLKMTREQMARALSYCVRHVRNAEVDGYPPPAFAERAWRRLGVPTGIWYTSEHFPRTIAKAASRGVNRAPEKAGARAGQSRPVGQRGREAAAPAPADKSPGGDFPVPVGNSHAPSAERRRVTPASDPIYPIYPSNPIAPTVTDAVTALLVDGVCRASTRQRIPEAIRAAITATDVTGAQSVIAACPPDTLRQAMHHLAALIAAALAELIRPQSTDTTAGDNR